MSKIPKICRPNFPCCPIIPKIITVEKFVEVPKIVEVEKFVEVPKIVIVEKKVDSCIKTTAVLWLPFVQFDGLKSSNHKAEMIATT